MPKARLPFIPVLASGLCVLAVSLGIRHFHHAAPADAPTAAARPPAPRALSPRSPSRPLPDDATLADLGHRIRAGEGGSWQELQGLCANAAPSDFDRLWQLIASMPDNDSMKQIIQAQIVYELAAQHDLSATPAIVAQLLPDQGDHFAARDAVLEMLAVSEATPNEYLRFVSALPAPSLNLEKRLSSRLQVLLPELCAASEPLDPRSRRLLLDGLAGSLIQAVMNPIADQARETALSSFQSVQRAEQAGCVEKGASLDLLGRLACADPAKAAVLLQQPVFSNATPELLPALNDLARFETEARAQGNQSGIPGFASGAVPFSSWIQSDPAAAESWFRTHRNALPPSLADSIVTGFVFVASYSPDSAASQRWVAEIRDPDLRGSYAAMVKR